MTEKEERILRQNADEVNQHAETFQEMKLYNAMRGGIIRGKKRRMRHIYSYGVGAIAATAAAVLLTFSSIGLPAEGVAEHSVQTASTKNWDDFKAYRSSSRINPALASALEQNLVKPVRQSAENKGYRIDVAGAVTDGRKVFVLYSVQNNTDKEVTHADDSLQFGTYQDPYPRKGTSLDILAGDSRIRAGQSVDFIYSTNLSPSRQYSKDVKLGVVLTETSEQALVSSSSKYRTSLEVAFELDPDLLKERGLRQPVDRTLTVDGQKINVRQVLFTPLSTYVDLEYNKANDKRIFSLINPVLIGKSGDQTEKLAYPSRITSDNSEVYSDDSKFTLVFKHSQYDQLDSATLKIAGIAALDKDRMKIVVDLNKKQIIEAPGSDIAIARPEPEDNAEVGEILFRRKIEKALQYRADAQGAVQLDNLSMGLADSFTDAEGQVHKKTHRSTTEGNFGGYILSNEGTAVDEVRFNFGEEAKDYPQPLTLTIERYWNPIMDSQAVELFSKN